MLVFVIGGSGSGKSEWAEKKAMELSDGGRALYAATMRRDGEEAEKRIEHHRKARKDRDFITAELPYDLRGLSGYSSVADTVLIEDLSNLLTNLRYFRNMSFETAEEEIKSQIKDLSKNFKNIIIVSNDVFSDGIEYPEETMGFIRSLSGLNIGFAARTDLFAEVVVGIPLIKIKS